MKYILSTLTSFILTLWVSSSIAQSYVHQVLVLNEGYYDYSSSTIVTPVTIGSYDPASQTYQTVYTIDNARFASDLIIHEGFYYVAADSKIIKFDLNTHLPVAEAFCTGVRNLAIYNNIIIATRGEYLLNLDSHLQLFHAGDLSPFMSFNTTEGPQYPTQNIIVHNGIAYIAVNNAFDFGNEVGRIGQLNLTTLEYGNEIDLGAEGKNPDNMILFGNDLITVNNLDWTGASISRFSTIDNTWENHSLSSATSGCGTSALNEEKLLFQISMDTVLRALDLNTMSESDVAAPQIPYYELSKDPVNGLTYASATDYFSFGQVYVLNDLYEVTGTFSVGISPGTIVFDVRSSLGIREHEKALLVYPNPACERISLDISSSQEFSIRDITGKVVMTGSGNHVNLNDLLAGTYMIHSAHRKASFVVIK